MTCVFCGQNSPEETSSHSRKSLLEDETFFRVLCRALGLTNPTLKSLAGVPMCDSCYDICCEVQGLVATLERLKGQIDQKLSELKNKVGVVSADVESVEESVNEDAGSDVARFRAQIVRVKGSGIHCCDTHEGPLSVLNDIKNEHENVSSCVKQECTDTREDARERGTADLNEDKHLEEFQITPDCPDPSDSCTNPSQLAGSISKTKCVAGSKEVKRKLSKRRTSVSSNKPEENPTTTSSKVKRRVPRKKSKPRGQMDTVNETTLDVETSNSNTSDEGDGATPNIRRKLPCSICKKYFRKPSLLRRHQLIVHEKQRPFECPICSKGFARKNVYTMHLIQVHETEDNQPFSCSICHKKFTLEQLKDRHESFHQLDTTKPLSCPHCDIRFAADDQTGLDKHIQFIHIKRPNTFYCEQCNTSFQNRNLKLRHDSQVHLDKFIHECKSCDKRYSIKAFLVTHMKTHSRDGPFQCTVCKWEVLTGDLLAEHLLSHTGEKRVKCGECQERFFSTGELKRHRVHEHGAEKPYECTICSKRFILNSDRTAHLREVHEGFPNQCVCVQCNKGFANPKYLKNHIRKIHEMKKVVVCEVCGKRLADTSSLKDHMNSHEGIKPYACSFCSQRFVKKNTLKCHILTHTGEKPFVCPICSKGYTQSHCLKTHLKSHKNESNTSNSNNNSKLSQQEMSNKSAAATTSAATTEAVEKLLPPNINSITITSNSNCIATSVITVNSAINNPCGAIITPQHISNSAVINQPAVIVATQSTPTTTAPLISVQPDNGSGDHQILSTPGQPIPIVAVGVSHHPSPPNQVFAVDQVAFASMFPNL